MSYMKRELENWLYTAPAVDVFDYLVDLGWDEDDAIEFVKSRPE